ncbi:TPA: hypothetical protein ACODIZ_003657 [Salmonella enterica subsp. enterica serovar Newport]
MSKSTKSAIAEVMTEAEAVTQEAPIEFAQTLTEFCTRLSVTETRHALIAGFHYTEKAAGRMSDIPSAYAKRYAEFLTTPAQ